MNFLNQSTAQLQKEFASFRQDPVQSFRINLRRVRAKELQKLLSNPSDIDFNTFNKEVWQLESKTLHGSGEITGLSFKDTLTPEQAVEFDAWLDAGELELHGNYVWGSGTKVYGASSKESPNEKMGHIRKALRFLNDTNLTPLRKAEEIVKIKGFGDNIGTGLVMMYHPEDFAIRNQQSTGALDFLGHRTDPLEEFQKAIGNLKDILGASDFLELDGFLFLINQNQISLDRPRRFWWINQGQRYKIEREEGYWSTKDCLHHIAASIWDADR